jgi:hypothetical protein
MIGSAAENDGSGIDGKMGTIHAGYVCNKRRLLGRCLSLDEKRLTGKHLL